MSAPTFDTPRVIEELEPAGISPAAAEAQGGLRRAAGERLQPGSVMSESRAAAASPRSAKQACPACGRAGAEVSARTIAHHIAAAWRWTPSAERHFFCASPACQVVYFGADGATIRQAQLRTRVGIKDADEEAPLCYCFGISRADFRNDPTAKDYVIAQTKAGMCACETHNPSGRCCLKDFPGCRAPR